MTHDHIKFTDFREIAAGEAIRGEAADDVEGKLPSSTRSPARKSTRWSQSSDYSQISQSMTMKPQKSLLGRAHRRGSQAELVILPAVVVESSPKSIKLADLMDETGAGWYQAQVLPSLLGVVLVEGGQVQLMSSIAMALEAEWQLTAEQRTCLPTLAFCGLAVGTILSGVLSDAWGRRSTILLGFAAVCASSLSLATALYWEVMALLIFVNGLACGLGVTAAAVMVTELCPAGVRAVAFVLRLLAQALGEIYTVVVINAFLPDLVHGSWRAAVVMGSLPAFACLAVSSSFLRESPYWLVAQDRVAEARTEILAIARLNGTSDNVALLADTLDQDVVAPSASGATALEGKYATMMKACSSRRFVITTVCFAFLSCVGQALTFGMSCFWPALLQSPELRNSALSPASALGLIRSCGVPSALLMIPIVWSPVGHRWIIGISGLLMAAAMLVCIGLLSSGASTGLIPAAGLSLGCASLFYTVSMLFMTESFPTDVRAVMAAFCVSIGRTGALMAPTAAELLGFRGFMVLVLLLSCCAAPFLSRLEETKGRQLEDFVDVETDGDEFTEGLEMLQPLSRSFEGSAPTRELECDSSNEASGADSCDSRADGI